MRDFSKCPSCSGPGSIYKDGFYRYQHGIGCKMGKFYEKGSICTSCGAQNSKFIGTFPADHSPLQKGDDRWPAPDECPICWVIAEAKSS